MPKKLLQIKNLQVTVDGKTILHDLSLNIEPGKVYALMGPNGSGKSTLSNTIMGHSKYHVEKGKILSRGVDITHESPDLRAQRGLFLSFQYPKSIPGVSMSNFLRAAYKAVKKKEIRVFDFNKLLKQKMEMLHIPKDFADRFVNEGFSGGEKKKAEILQALVLDPSVIIMDETDSGLDVDALKVVAAGVQQLRSPDKAVILITHYFRILQYLTPDVVYVLKHGHLVAEGGHELAKRIEKDGFDEFGKNLSDPHAAKKRALETTHTAMGIEMEEGKPESEESPFAVID
ncbi:MAG: Fe-S cluster assembly ATPase SufC [bacterium]|nr:Fe-S cluster assembly ATPase SufC [bacterium]